MFNLTPLINSCDNGKIEIAKLLIENKAEIDYKTSESKKFDGMTIIHWAALFGNLNYFRFARNIFFLNFTSCKVRIYKRASG